VIDPQNTFAKSAPARSRRRDTRLMRRRRLP
jgi:hypothetical protein